MIARNPRAARSLGVDCDIGGNVRIWPATNGTYPPVGYLRWAGLEVGNGDTYGFYWPIGHEERDPIICTTEHDVWRLVPLASDLAASLRLLRATQPEIAAEVKQVASACGVSLSGRRSCGRALSTEALWGLDPRSPQLLVALGREALRTGDLTLCEQSILTALDLLPEYGEAAYVLSQVYRRQRRLAQAAQAMLVVIGSPLCFGGGGDLRLKCLRSLQGMRDDVLPGDDVLWRQRQRLTLRADAKYNEDFHIFEEAIGWYLASGAGARAIALKMLVGELLARETLSFQQRLEWTPATQRRDLEGDLRRAGLVARISALGMPSE